MVACVAGPAATALSANAGQMPLYSASAGVTMILRTIVFVAEVASALPSYLLCTAAMGERAYQMGVFGPGFGYRDNG